ncbi:MAG: hypothetical protein JW793_08920 [Acidobacteria bacterium]|nr:hypothetical protein [Acidobacteriota bacterium]
MSWIRAIKSLVSGKEFKPEPRPDPEHDGELVFDVTQPCPVCGTFYSDPVVQQRHFDRAHVDDGPRESNWRPIPYYRDAEDYYQPMGLMPGRTIFRNWLKF